MSRKEIREVSVGEDGLIEAIHDKGPDELVSGEIRKALTQIALKLYAEGRGRRPVGVTYKPPTGGGEYVIESNTKRCHHLYRSAVRYVLVGKDATGAEVQVRFFMDFQTLRDRVIGLESQAKYPFGAEGRTTGYQGLK